MYVFGMHSICLTDLHLKRTFVWIDMGSRKGKLCIASNNEPNKYMTIMIIIISNSFAGMCQFHCKTPYAWRSSFLFFFHSNWLETWVNITNFFSWKEMRSRPHDVVHPVNTGIFQHSKNFMIPIWLLFHKVENFSRFLKAKSFNAKIVRKLS